MEAGNRCFDENLPEETNVPHRGSSLMSTCATASMPAASLNYEGVAKERTFVTGSPMAEVLRANMEKNLNSRVLEDLV